MLRLSELKFIENNKSMSAYNFLKRPNNSYKGLRKHMPEYEFADLEIGKNCAIKIKYEGYIVRQNSEVKRNKIDLGKIYLYQDITIKYNSDDYT